MRTSDRLLAAASFDALIAGSDLPRLEARALLEHASARSREWLIAHGDEAPGADLAARFAELAQRRRAGEPLAYLVGEREFHGRCFKVDPAVLIPRPETELLVDLVVQAAREDATLLELGTGSGCIAVTLACLRSDLHILATDASEQALATASNNAAKLCPKALAAARLQFRAGDWWSAVNSGEHFDLIVSNPPYIAAADPHLAQGDLRFEPANALASGDDGLDALRVICAGAPLRLRAAGMLFLEHGFEQGAVVRALLGAAGFEQISTLHDAAGLDRVTTGRLPA